jgi:hypothetical protein
MFAKFYFVFFLQKLLPKTDETNGNFRKIFYKSLSENAKFVIFPLILYFWVMYGTIVSNNKKKSVIHVFHIQSHPLSLYIMSIINYGFYYLYEQIRVFNFSLVKNPFVIQYTYNYIL